MRLDKDHSPFSPFCFLKRGVLVRGFEFPHRGLRHTRGEMCHRQQQAASPVGARSGETAFFLLLFSSMHDQQRALLQAANKLSSGDFL